MKKNNLKVVKIDKNKSLFNYEKKILINELILDLKLGYYELFLKVGQQMLQAYEHYYSPNSVSFGLHLAKLAKVSIYLNKTEEALQYWKESLRIMKLSHGENSLMVSYLYSLRDTISL